MCPKIRCDGKSEKFCKIFWELNWALKTFAAGATTTSGHRSWSAKTIDYSVRSIDYITHSTIKL
jgi:hypothetical protein